MTTVTQSPYTEDQISAWLRGLCTVAWADGHFDPEEKELVSQLTHELLEVDKDPQSVEQTISAEELAAALGHDDHTAENFIRTAVMVAMADGIYSATEDNVLQEFCEALGLKIEALNSLRHTLYDGEETDTPEGVHQDAQQPGTSPHPHSDILHPLRKWLDGMDIHDPTVARFVCNIIPSQCPFERDVNLFGRKVAHIPAMCKLNPLYDQLVGLRFRALSYLADERGEDVSKYF